MAKAVTLTAVTHTTDMKKLWNHHFLSNQARINLKTALMDAGIEALMVIYQEKQVSLLRILAEAVTVAAVMHTTEMKKLGNHHFLSNEARVNLKMALIYAGIEALKVIF